MPVVLACVCVCLCPGVRALLTPYPTPTRVPPPPPPPPPSSSQEPPINFLQFICFFFQFLEQETNTKGESSGKKIFFLPERYLTTYSGIGFNPILKRLQPWLKKYLIKLAATSKIILPTAVPKFPQRRSLFSPLSDHSVQLIQTFVSQLSITYHFLFIKLDKFASLGVGFIPDFFFIIFGTPQRAAEKRFKSILAIWARPYKKQNIILMWGLCWPLPTSKLQLQM